MEDTINRDYKSIENDILKLESVISCRFVIENKEVKEIHIVSNGTRSPKQISRDVQSVLIATYDLNIDYKKITIEDNCNRINIKIGLSDDSNTYESTISGINTARNIDRMLVQVVLDCVEKSLGTEGRFILDEVRNVNLSSDGIVVVVLVYIIDAKERHLCGSSLIENNHKKAVVKATLDALNRCISK